ncbi:hypothetical protein B5C34_12675 [Pacificimonas flava]|uniref:Uncharacterized protein n=2 Tax=Pacificimonas TaxID=1960290 RepID=A0A219B789_9SPHN|nr:MULTISPECIES: DUF4159 domain-containing protein [Pacificimonas]MBZ6378479.1 DUF4159 domain-containing protein [Pacificimonas aurantium]OWV34227.1 hypothetical protein B5C34_12675 [Pacificimonas flava]
MGGLSFAAPFLLAALAVLPALWLLLRQTPPPPRSARLPTLILLAEADIPPDRAKRPPWLLLLLRLLILGLVVLGLAGPEWRPELERAPPDRLALVIDNGWASADRWAEMVDAAERRIEAYETAGTRFAVIPTARLDTVTEQGPADRSDSPAAARFTDAETALSLISALRPRPWGPDRAAAAERVPPADDFLWISDGFETGGAAALRSRLEGGAILAFPAGSPVFLAAEPTSGGVAGRLAAPEDTETPALLTLRSHTGRSLQETRVPVQSGGATFRLDLGAADLREGERLSAGPSAASTFLLTGASASPRLSLVASEENRPPLETGAFYIRRAAEPVADVETMSLEEAVTRESGLIILDDVPVAQAAAEPLLARVEEGLVLVSFAGERIAENGTSLSPVALRRGARAFGGTLTWQQPMTVAGFASDGPLAGLPLDESAVIRRQLLTEPPGRDVMVWATLEDGTPLVTAERRGDGLLVLVHTAASPDWSDLPLSGLFAQIVGRLARLGSDPQAFDIASTAPWRLERQLDGHARLGPPDRAAVISPDDWASARAGPDTPPGLYRSGDLVRPLNTASALPPDFRFEDLARGGLRPAEAVETVRPLGAWLLSAALALLLLDMLVALALRGRLSLRSSSRPGMGMKASGAAVLVLASLLSFAAPLQAQPLIAPSTSAAEREADLQLAFIGGTAADDEVREGLRGLSRTLARRTAVAAGEPAAISASADDIGRYPLVYWPAYARGAMSAAEAANIRNYLSRGGLVLFDFGRPLGAGTDARTLLGALGLPPLSEATPDHVLLKSYYLLDGTQGGALWVEADTEGDSGRVSSVAIGGGDWARLWGGTATAAPSEREAALRFGVNLVMYALTGTYKADQVHTETLLDRIGRGRAD